MPKGRRYGILLNFQKFLKFSIIRLCFQYQIFKMQKNRRCYLPSTSVIRYSNPTKNASTLKVIIVRFFRMKKQQLCRKQRNLEKNMSPSKRQLPKMVKHTQTIRRQFPGKLSVLDHFVGCRLKGLKVCIQLKNGESTWNYDWE